MPQLRRIAALATAVAAGLLLAATAVSADAGGRRVQVVGPQDSIQEAIDAAAPGSVVLIRPGTYRENASATNALQIDRGIHLIGLSTPRRRVVLENAGDQRNGIVAVPSEHYDCMSCHESLAPPFTLRPHAEGMTLSQEPTIYGLTISGITIRGFGNNGLFARGLDGFRFVDVESIDNPNYGIFPVSSRNGLIAHSRATGADDSGIWVETSQNVRVVHNVAEGNVNGFEVSNSDDIVLAHNVARGNTVGMAILFLPDIFDVRPDARRITIRSNEIVANNKPNTARPGSILSTVSPGVGILHLGVDDSRIVDNAIEDHDLIGVAIVDYCLAVQGSPFDCAVDPDVSPGFVADSEATNNRIVDNRLANNGTNPDPTDPFAFAASDLGLLTLGDHGNCFAGNVFTTFFSTLGVLPPCP